MKHRRKISVQTCYANDSGLLFYSSSVVTTQYKEVRTKFGPGRPTLKKIIFFSKWVDTVDITAQKHYPVSSRNW